MSEAPRRGRGRPRKEGADGSILAATMTLLRERKYAEVTLDRIAAASGNARTTLYRRWRSKGALVASALAASLPPLPAGDDLPLLLQWTTGVVSGEYGAVLAALSVEAGADAELSTEFLELIAPRERYLRAIALARGRDDVDLDRVIDSLIGPIWFRALVRHTGPQKPLE